VFAFGVYDGPAGAYRFVSPAKGRAVA